MTLRTFIQLNQNIVTGSTDKRYVLNCPVHVVAITFYGLAAPYCTITPKCEFECVISAYATCLIYLQSLNRIDHFRALLRVIWSLPVFVVDNVH